jgi:hypothetical protein
VIVIEVVVAHQLQAIVLYLEAFTARNLPASHPQLAHSFEWASNSTSNGILLVTFDLCTPKGD